MINYGANEKSFRKSGLMEAAKSHYQNISAEAIEVDFPQEFISRVSLSRAVLEADVIISIPKFKTHVLTIISGTINNSYGFLPGALKARLHCRAGNALRFSELRVEVFRLNVHAGLRP